MRARRQWERGMNRPISTLMQHQVTVVDMDDTIARVESVFASNALSWAPVMDGPQTVVGVISAVDLLQFHAQERDANRVHAWQLCTYKPIMVSPDTPLHEVARQMVARRIHHVVVMQAERVAGVVSSLDLLQALVLSP